MPLGEEIKLLPVFSLTHVNNTGIAFGLFQNQNWIFGAIGIIVVGAMVVMSAKMYKDDRATSLILAGVIGGALGNLTDRLYYGHVTDFLDFYIGSHHWPVFNIGDSAICIGAGLLIWRNIFCKGKN